MLFLLLVYFLTQSNPGDTSPIPLIQPRADVSCNDLNNCRTIWDIIWSCFSTIFLCTWVTLHPNIAIDRNTRDLGWFQESVLHPLLGFLKNKLPLLLCALVAPEYILAWAVRQYLVAGNIQQKGRFLLVPVGILLNVQHPVPGWTRTHGFFLIMGGYHLYRLPDSALSNQYPPEFNLPTELAILQPLMPHSREEEIAERPLHFADLSVSALAYLAPSKTEIKDKGKFDVLAKVITLVQTLWFVVQCIARGVRQLPLTEIEVVILAYATVNVFICYFWRSKPKDVECPVRVYKALNGGPVEMSIKWEWDSGMMGILQKINAFIVGEYDRFLRLSEQTQVPMFWSGNPSGEILWHAAAGASAVGIVVGAVHFIAWNSKFPSYTEHLFWRISCIAIISIPLNVTVAAGILEMNWQDKLWGNIISAIITLSAPLTASLYLFARIAASVMVFTTLWALPLGALETVDWTTCGRRWG